MIQATTKIATLQYHTIKKPLLPFYRKKGGEFRLRPLPTFVLGASDPAFLVSSP